MADENDNLPATVPFGKHKGKPVEVLTADRSYLEWLRLQPWATERYPWLLVLRVAAAPNVDEETPTPEHNRLQAQFLDAKLCAATVALLRCVDIYSNNREEVRVVAQFEVEAVDVVLCGSYNQIIARLELKPIIGDDFPAVLRKFKRLTDPMKEFYRGLDRGWVRTEPRAIIAEHFAATGLTFEQARAMAVSSGVKMFLMSEIEAERDRLFPLAPVPPSAI